MDSRSPAHQPGFCYLHLFHPDDRVTAAMGLGPYPVCAAVAARLLGQRPLRSSADFFVLTFGTPASLQRSDALLGHVEPAPSGTSQLKWRDVLRLVPVQSHIGGVDEQDVQAHAPTNVAPATSVLGHAFDPRVFSCLSTPVTMGLDSGLAAQSTVTKTVALDPLAGNFLAWCNFQPVVRFTKLSVLFVPTKAAESAQITILHAWYPATAAAPTSASDFYSQPTADIAIVQLSASDGNVITTLHAAETGEVQFQVKPLPAFGGYARFAARVTVTVGESGFDKDTRLGNFHFRIAARCTV